MNRDQASKRPAGTPSGPSDLPVVIDRVDAFLARFLDARALPANLDGAIRYSLLGGGKRVRPALAWYSAVACGGSGEVALPGGAAVEMIHAFSLIHDDLPAMDDDDLRRGRPTLHRHTSEAMAILAGDALLSLAYESALDNEDPRVARALCTELAEGTRRMIEGQVFDTLGGLPEQLDSLGGVELIHRSKTGALLRASCRIGAISAGASEPMLDAITRYSEAIGLQFQIIDDLLDVEGCADAVGKAVGKDAAAGKRTYPGVVGVERSREMARDLGEKAMEALRDLGEAGAGDTEPLRLMGELLTHRRS